MCGIAGIISSNRSTKIDRARLQAMSSALHHRGPDDEGVYINEPEASVGLAHRRLSIIDLSAAGRQPMSNEDGSLNIVLNGEIYNFKELKHVLEVKGHVFKSNTDTEVVIHLYEEYGEDCLRHLRGMFAFAIWNEKNRSLFLVRDRAGKKPLLYHYSNGTLVFASEFASLLQSGLIDKETDHDAVNYYFTFGYIPSPMSIYKNVYKLPPAHYLTLKNGQITIKRYWQLDYSKKTRISEEDAAGKTLEILKEATEIRLHSDVPLGAFLSGGIDSSAVVAVMSMLSGNKVKTFSIGFEESGYNELEYARNIAKRYGTIHNEFIVRPNALEVLPLLVERYGEPYADSSCIPTYYVSRETRKFVTVALNGDGGDETFAGYERYQAMVMAEMYQRLPPLLRNAIIGASKLLPDSINPKNRIRNIKRFFQAVAMPTAERYQRWICVFDDESKNRLYSKSFKNSLSDNKPSSLIRRYLDKTGDSRLLDKVLNADTNIYLPDDLLVKVDIASMACALEARSPFLDHILMEFAASLPQRYKMKNFVKKYILKKAIKDIVPKENIYRRKMGFGVPVGEWFRGELKGFLKDTLLSEKAGARGYFDKSIVEYMIKEHVERRADFKYQLWSLLMFELWNNRFID